MHRKIAIIGLGYVGLPLAVEFGKKYTTVGYDIDIDRINDLNSSKDTTREVTKKQIQSSSNLIFSSNVQDIEENT